jgi:heme A synthase
MIVNGPKPENDLDPNFIERERNRLAGRALAFLIGLNGIAALVLLTIIAMEPQATVDRKVTMAMLVFSGGALAALFSSFLAYVNRTVRLESPGRRGLRRALRIVAILTVVGSGAAFLIGMNMVATTQAEKSSSHPKSRREDKPPKPPQIKNAALPAAFGVRWNSHA